MNLLENKTLLISGLGLIGGSIARGLIAAGAGIRILAHGRDEQALQTALIDGSIHAYSTDLATLAPQADIVMLCTPTMTVRPMLEQLAQLIGPDTVITDAASVKGNVVADARRIFPDSLHRVVPGHPVAGSEQSGYRASKHDLFQQRKVILTPLPENSSIAVRTVMQLWQSLGADVHAMSATRHDQVLAGTSHLPHLLAFTLVNTLVDSVGETDRAQQVFDYAAGGFADFSRIASSDPVMWRDIFLANREATVDVLDIYIKSLEQMKLRLLKADGQGLESEFRRAKRVRDEFIRRFRPDSAHADGQHHPDKGFRVEPASISVRKGSFLQGVFSPPATQESAVSAINDALLQPVVTVMKGVPESVAMLAYLHQLRTRGVPVTGPEHGTVWLFGEVSDRQVGHSAHLHEVCLAVDAFLAGLLVLASSLRAGSALEIDCPAIGLELETLLAAFSALGIQTAQRPGQDGSVQLQCSHQTPRPASLGMDLSVLSDEQLALVVVAAGLGTGQTNLLMPFDKASHVIDYLGELGSWLAEIEYIDGKLVVTPRERVAAAISTAHNPALSLLAIVAGQVLEGELIVNRPGDIAAHYPGLLAELTSLGMHFTLHQS